MYIPHPGGTIHEARSFSDYLFVIFVMIFFFWNNGREKKKAEEEENKIKKTHKKCHADQCPNDLRS